MTDDRDAEISPLAMSLMGSIAYGGPLPRTVTASQMEKLSEGECWVLDRAIRKKGLTLSYDQRDMEFTIDGAER
jgi:hypothetical protein